MSCYEGLADSVDRGELDPMVRSLNTTSHGYQVLGDITGSAPTSVIEKFEVRPGDCGEAYGWSDCKKDRERSELTQKHKETKPGKTEWYGWFLYVPEDYVNIYPTKVALGQFHQIKSHPVWLFQNGAGGYFLDRQVSGRSDRYYPLIEEEDFKGHWHRVEIQAKWSKEDDGLFNFWINGEQKVAYAGRTMTAEKVYFKYGLYRSFLSRYKQTMGSKRVPAQTVYYANVKSGQSRDDLN